MVITRYGGCYCCNLAAGVSTEPAEKRLQETEDGQMNENISLRKQRTVDCSSDPFDLPKQSTVTKRCLNNTAVTFIFILRQ